MREYNYAYTITIQLLYKDRPVFQPVNLTKDHNVLIQMLQCYLRMGDCYSLLL
ncbi:hypothetical protein [Anaerobutyricum hallii]|uniref:hypothetical protein n=1 Tax=Anaerobutyricum hallii TaxID=39488 RepID=UPI0016515036|nr:hypothetical protein [Anaerobutyricum hallii]